MKRINSLVVNNSQNGRHVHRNRLKRKKNVVVVFVFVVRKKKRTLKGNAEVYANHRCDHDDDDDDDNDVDENFFFLSFHNPLKSTFDFDSERILIVVQMINSVFK